MKAHQQPNPTRTIPNSTATRQLKWSARLRNSEIAIHESVLIRTKDGVNSHGYTGMCGLTNSIGELANNCKWGLRINALTYGMVIGICRIGHAQQHQFERWYWSGISHGHYCIDDKGFVFSYSNANINCQI